MVAFTSDKTRGVSHRREEAVESSKRTQPSPRVSVDKTVSVLLKEALSLNIPGPMMICMGHRETKLDICRPESF